MTTQREQIAMKAECLAEKENGHHKTYLTWVHQADKTCYYKCEMCGWIMLDDRYVLQKIAEARVETAERILNEWLDKSITKGWKAMITKCEQILSENSCEVNNDKLS